MLAIAASIECPRSFSIGSKSDTVVPRSMVPAVWIAPPACSRASKSIVLPAPGWPARATLRICSVRVGHEAVSPVVGWQEGRHGCPHDGSAAVRAGARRAVMAGDRRRRREGKPPAGGGGGSSASRACTLDARTSRPRSRLAAPPHPHGAPPWRSRVTPPRTGKATSRPARASSTRRRAACSPTRRYGFNTRFGDEKGTNPEELIAAAHAGCFTMALSAKLTEAGHPPASLDTRAEVELSMEGGPTISRIRLKVTADVPGIDAAKFRALADDAEQNCPVSQALSAVPITLEAELVAERCAAVALRLPQASARQSHRRRRAKRFVPIALHALPDQTSPRIVHPQFDDRVVADFAALADAVEAGRRRAARPARPATRPAWRSPRPTRRPRTAPVRRPRPARPGNRPDRRCARTRTRPCCRCSCASRLIAFQSGVGSAQRGFVGNSDQPPAAAAVHQRRRQRAQRQSAQRRAQARVVGARRLPSPARAACARDRARRRPSPSTRSGSSRRSPSCTSTPSRGVRQAGLEHGVRGADARMPGERHFAARAEDAQADSSRTGVRRREHEGRFRQRASSARSPASWRRPAPRASSTTASGLPAPGRPAKTSSCT